MTLPRCLGFPSVHRLLAFVPRRPAFLFKPPSLCIAGSRMNPLFSNLGQPKRLPPLLPLLFLPERSIAVVIQSDRHSSSHPHIQLPANRLSLLELSIDMQTYTQCHAHRHSHVHSFAHTYVVVCRPLAPPSPSPLDYILERSNRRNHTFTLTHANTHAYRAGGRLPTPASPTPQANFPELFIGAAIHWG